MFGVLLLVLVVAIGWPADVARAQAWRLPVDGRVVGRFAVGPDPFAAGQRRGVDLAVAAGTRVVAPCGGRVAFAGRVPGFGAGVSLRCGRLTATVLGLGGVSVRAGATVGRGAVVGAAGAGERVRLGARVTGDRFGYRDPLALLGAERPARGPLVGPPPSRRRVTPPAPRVPTAVPAPVPGAAPTPGHSGAPALAWIGVALIACALPGGAIAWRVRRLRAPRAYAQRAEWAEVRPRTFAE